MKYYSNYRMVFESANLENNENTISPEYRKINQKRFMHEISPEDRDRITKIIDNDPEASTYSTKGLRKLKIGAGLGAVTGTLGSLAANHYGYNAPLPHTALALGGFSGLVGGGVYANKDLFKSDDRNHQILDNELKKLDKKK